MNDIKVIGWTDNCKCERCGREDLERTIAIENDGETYYYGSECIKKVLGAKKGKEILSRIIIIDQLKEVYKSKGWEAVKRFALMKYGWGERDNYIKDGYGKPVLHK